MVTAKTFLRNGHIGRAQAFDKLKRYAEAISDWESAANLQGNPNRNMFDLRAALSRARGGNHVEAAAAANALAAARNLDGRIFYDLARVFAVCFVAATDDAPLREQYALRAVDLLGQAKSKKLFQDRIQLDNFRIDPDLDALRQRDDFKKLMEDLPKP
jgi:hypothetical protein